jgi:hypothetical protein
MIIIFFLYLSIFLTICFCQPLDATQQRSIQNVLSELCNGYAVCPLDASKYGNVVCNDTANIVKCAYSSFTGVYSVVSMYVCRKSLTSRFFVLPIITLLLSFSRNYNLKVSTQMLNGNPSGKLSDSITYLQGLTSLRITNQRLTSYFPSSKILFTINIKVLSKL